MARSGGNYVQADLPHGLPLPRGIDHRIKLLPNSTPIVLNRWDFDGHIAC